LNDDHHKPDVPDDLEAGIGETLYTAAQTRAIDQSAIEVHGIPGATLMSLAASATFVRLLARWPSVSKLQVFCGTGNNGGDGFLIADQAMRRGLDVVVFQVGDPDKIRGDALRAREQALANGVLIKPFDGNAEPLGVVVDALLGTGLGGPVRPEYADAIAVINATSLPVVAVDIPSGLCADTGSVLGAAVRADLTVTFIALKQGLFTYEAPHYAGDIEYSDLGVPAAAYSDTGPGVARLSLEAQLGSRAPRPATAHKGLYGTALVVGGDFGMAGAVMLATEAALRCGTGLVKVATRAEHIAPLVARTPEAMPHAVEAVEALSSLAETANAIVIGPGLGQSHWAQELLEAVLASNKPLVVDADALNLMANKRATLPARGNWVLTPHPGEAARLLGCSTAAIQADRFGAVRALQARYKGVVVLKGNGTLVADDASIALSDYGNPGMASGGMGDVLSGIVGAFLAQKMAPLAAARLGASLHGAAADVAARDGERGLLASDLMQPLRELLG